jgi:hypothetical protein
MGDQTWDLPITEYERESLINRLFNFLDGPTASELAGDNLVVCSDDPDESRVSEP